MREVGPISAVELTALADSEDAAKVAMDAAGNDLVEARMTHRGLVAARAGF